MKTLRLPLALMTLALMGAAASGCGKSTSPLSSNGAISANDAADIAQQVSMDMASQGDPSMGTTSARPAPGGAQALSVQQDTTFTAGAITWTLSRNWYDAGDNVQPFFDPATTVRVHATARGTGSISRTNFAATFGGAGALDVTGLLAVSDSAITNANRADTLQSAFTSPSTGAMRYFTCRQSSDWADVVQLKPVASNPWPLSGTATFQVDADRYASGARGSIDRHFTATVVVTFNGTRYPDVTVNRSWAFKCDLQTGAITRV